MSRLRNLSCSKLSPWIDLGIHLNLNAGGLAAVFELSSLYSPRRLKKWLTGSVCVESLKVRSHLRTASCPLCIPSLLCNYSALLLLPLHMLPACEVMLELVSLQHRAHICLKTPAMTISVWLLFSANFSAFFMYKKVNKAGFHIMPNIRFICNLCLWVY